MKKDRSSLFAPYTKDNIHPGFSIDCVIFSFYKRKLRILLNKFDFSRYWQLPGGFMFKNESSDDAAFRILDSRTGIKEAYLKQFYLFSDPQRTKMEQNAEYIDRNAQRGEYSEKNEEWFLQRFVSLGYYAFVKYDNVKLSVKDEDIAKWFDIENLPDLYSDHKNIIRVSLEIIKSILPVLPIGAELLPEKFAISELRKIYETVLGRGLDRRNFQRKALASGVVIQLDEVKNASLYNPPILYSFNKKYKGIMDSSFF
ncbi:MAG: NUDIX domain-containing protein [Prevotella sp.]|jgi:ADP-ribose pyrophosphatase YjhB (NUDIX family)|nr:NUDIX domain-containing protein [Prevotella sp.]